jgi:hypothetical protein
MYERQYRGDKASWFSYLSLSPRAFRDTAQLPCFILPPTRTARFFDREDAIEKIEKHFQDSSSISSYARWPSLVWEGSVRATLPCDI